LQNAAQIGQPTTSKESIKMLQKRCEILRVYKGKTLTASIHLGICLHKAFQLHKKRKRSSKKNDKFGTWKTWLNRNVKLQQSQDGKLRVMGELLESYPRFKKLSITFTDLYLLRHNIRDMLKNPYLAKNWC